MQMNSTIYRDSSGAVPARGKMPSTVKPPRRALCGDAAGTKLDSANRTGGESVETHSRGAQSVAEAIFSPPQVLRRLAEKVL